MMRILSSARRSSALPAVRSERGVALVVVLLLMAVLSGLATGFAMNGNVEVQMGTNEIYYAGARAAAEAGLNRAIAEIVDPANTIPGTGPPEVNVNTVEWLAGVDGDAAATDDNGQLDFLLGAGPYALDAAGQYTYDIEILDDDNPVLYAGDITAQIATMGEDGNIHTDLNDKLILRATGFGPNGTIVRIARVLDADEDLITPVSTEFDAAIIVNGAFEMNGAITINGTSGSVHANGNLSKTGVSGTITGNATTAGTYSGGVMATGATISGAPTVNVPDIQAANFEHLADYKLAANGSIYTRNTLTGTWNTSACTTCSIDWTSSVSGGVRTWSTGKNPTGATYYVEGKVSVGPTSGSTNKPVSIIATNDINVYSNQAKLTPFANNIQFVTDGDLVINASDLDSDVLQTEGEIRVRGQMDAGGNMEFQGRVIVQDVSGAGSSVADGLTRIHGSVEFTYNGTLGAAASITGTGTPTYTNNVSGWMEQ